ncbi:WD repeat-containing protein 43 [Lycorma delicatula]|uniref:WD repeat-containing protein 43 n=1 Tax=Lycorma delicatula TaxID=130591 RepID=UPI003F515221
MGERVCFSPCGNYLVHFNVSGRLRIWETETSYLKQEFTPGSHLSSPCSCVAWISVYNSPVKSKKKKRKFGERQVLLLVLGTDAGQIYFFNVAEGEVVASLKEHNRPVSSITAAAGTDLYSSAENNIVQWDIPEKKVKRKWKCNGNVCNMLISDDNSILLTSLSSTVLCWNVETHTILRKFEGHKSNIIGLSMGVSPAGEKYVFSAAAEERLVNVWNITNTNLNKPVAMFTLPDVPSGISSNISSNGLVTFVAVCKRGSLSVYSLQLNGQCSKPLKPKTTVLVTPDESSTKKKTEVVPIIAGKVVGKGVKIAFGSSPFISCETIDLNTNDSELYLIRQDPRRSTKKKEESIKKVKSVETSSHVDYLSSASANSVSLKRDRLVLENEEKVTMESLLEKMNLSTKNIPSGDNLAHLLVQGLNSQDRDILRKVLLTPNENKIRSTVESLPAQAVLPLLKILVNLIQGRTFTSQVAAMWLQAVLRIHVSQLLADENCSSVIAPLMGLVESRLSCLGPLYQLKGRLNLLLDQATSSSVPRKPVIEFEPLLVYQDNDSPLNSNCLLEEEDDDDKENDEDDDRWTDLLNEDMSVESINGDDDGDEDSSHESEDSNENNDDEMEESSS